MHSIDHLADCRRAKEKTRLMVAGLGVVVKNRFAKLREDLHLQMKVRVEDRSYRSTLRSNRLLQNHLVSAVSLRVSFSRRALPVNPRK